MPPFIPLALIPSHKMAPWSLMVGFFVGSVGSVPDAPLPQGCPFTFLAFHPGIPAR